ncbi:MAG: response regulator, partial [Syntrophomonadaceae bacterium]|nr:response regulator [Syntrophomonadaceae bacterium]
MRTRIMVVDDEESLVKLIAHNLQREGYEVIPVRDGLEALARARSEAPDLIILDVMLPGLDGLEVCRRLRQDKVDIPVIMLTARDEEIDRVLGLEIGADDYV